jgi:hypothetical protein
LVKKDKICPRKKKKKKKKKKTTTTTTTTTTVYKRKSPKALPKGTNPWGKKEIKYPYKLIVNPLPPLSRSFQGEFEEANHVMKEFGTWWSLPNVQGLMIILYPLQETSKFLCGL